MSPSLTNGSKLILATLPSDGGKLTLITLPSDGGTMLKERGKREEIHMDRLLSLILNRKLCVPVCKGKQQNLKEM